MVQRVHSLDEAEDTLHRRGYYDVRVERASLPYSFNACKRGVRYHIHVNYYGLLYTRSSHHQRTKVGVRGSLGEHWAHHCV